MRCLIARLRPYVLFASFAFSSGFLSILYLQIGHSCKPFKFCISPFFFIFFFVVASFALPIYKQVTIHYYHHLNLYISFSYAI